MLAMGLVSVVVGAAGAAGDLLIGFAFAGRRDGADDVHALLAGLRATSSSRSCRCSCSPRRSSRSSASTACCAGSSRSTPLYRGGRAAARAVHRHGHARPRWCRWSTWRRGDHRHDGRLAPPRQAAADDELEAAPEEGRDEAHGVLGPDGAALGAAYARVWARQHVLAALGGRTVDQALDAGEPPKEVWRAVADALALPESAAVTRCTGAVAGAGGTAPASPGTSGRAAPHPPRAGRLPGPRRARQPVGIAVAAVLAQRVSGSDALAGLVQTFQVLGAAGASYLLARIMGARGRRAGLAPGYAARRGRRRHCASSGGAVESFPAAAGRRPAARPPPATNLQARYAAADLAPAPSDGPRAVAGAVGDDVRRRRRAQPGRPGRRARRSPSGCPADRAVPAVGLVHRLAAPRSSCSSRCGPTRCWWPVRSSGRADLTVPRRAPGAARTRAGRLLRRPPGHPGGILRAGDRARRDGRGDGDDAAAHGPRRGGPGGHRFRHQHPRARDVLLLARWWAWLADRVGRARGPRGWVRRAAGRRCAAGRSRRGRRCGSASACSCSGWAGRCAPWRRRAAHPSRAARRPHRGAGHGRPADERRRGGGRRRSAAWWSASSASARSTSSPRSSCSAWRRRGRGRTSVTPPRAPAYALVGSGCHDQR